MLVIYQKKQKGCNLGNVAEFSITSTKEMLEGIGVFIKKYNINYKINKRHKDRLNNNYTLIISGNQQIKSFCDFLYKDSNIFLNRKYETYLKLKEMSKNFRKRKKQYLIQTI